MSESKIVGITKAKNGYMVQGLSSSPYWQGEPQIFLTFEDAIEDLATKMGEEEFARTIKEAQNFSKGLTQLVNVAVAPKLAAIEAKVNPGVENLVDDSDDSLFA